MRILFISFDADPPFMGGTATVVNLLANYFEANNCSIALAYLWESDTPSVYFKNKVFLNKNNIDQVEEFFNKNEFDIIYDVLGCDTDFELLNKFKKNAKLIIAFHSRPHYRLLKLETLLLSYWQYNIWWKKIYGIVRVLLYPILNIFKFIDEKSRFVRMTNEADSILLLSDSYINKYKKLSNLNMISKIKVIPNPLVFSYSFDNKKLEDKEKTVLVVANLSYAKNINEILKIWKIIESDTFLDDWSFEFIGSGPGYERMKKNAENLGLKRLKFFGRQNPLLFFERASLFFMTSRYEGFPMVLLESIQQGVVPIVYNSFEALTEILDNGNCGEIINNGDSHSFYLSAKKLMLNDQLRIEKANNGIKFSNNYSIDVVGKSYVKYFKQIIENRQDL